MDKFEEIYTKTIPILASLGAGYSLAQDDWLKVTAYSIITAMFVTENILNRKNDLSRLESKI